MLEEEADSGVPSTLSPPVPPVIGGSLNVRGLAGGKPACAVARLVAPDSPLARHRSGTAQMPTVAIAGASLAGLSAARALRSQGYEGRLVLVGRERHRPYDRPPLSKGFLTGAIRTGQLTLEADEEDLGAEWLLGVEALRLDCPGRTLHLSDGSRLPADGIVLASGAQPRPLPGSSGLAGVHLLRTLEDAQALRVALAAADSLIVVGAGFLGSEVAATARTLGLDVTVVEAAPTPLAGPLGPTMGAVVAALHVDHGVHLRCGVDVRGVTGTGRAEGVALADGHRIDGDLVVVGVGTTPGIDWLADSGLALGDGVLCDAAGATNVSGVVAVGDCSAWYDPAVGRHLRVEHWTAAMERAPVAAATLLSGGTRPPPPLPPAYFWSEQYDSYIQFAGHTRPGDTVTVEEGDVDARRFLAVYRRADQPVAVLGLDQMRLFTRWRRRLSRGD